MVSFFELLTSSWVPLVEPAHAARLDIGSG